MQKSRQELKFCNNSSTGYEDGKKLSFAANGQNRLTVLSLFAAFNM